MLQTSKECKGHTFPPWLIFQDISHICILNIRNLSIPPLCLLPIAINVIHCVRLHDGPEFSGDAFKKRRRSSGCNKRQRCFSSTHYFSLMIPSDDEKPAANATSSVKLQEMRARNENEIARGRKSTWAEERWLRLVGAAYQTGCRYIRSHGWYCIRHILIRDNVTLQMLVVDSELSVVLMYFTSKPTELFDLLIVCQHAAATL